MIGKVYFVGAPGRIKVGYTQNPERRLRTLRHVDMEDLVIIAVIDGTRKTEKLIHAELAKYHLRGEWFKDCSDVHAIIDNAIEGKYSTDHENDFDPAPVKQTAASILANPSVLPDCYRLSEELTEAMITQRDKYEIRAKAEALITVTEILLGTKLRAQPCRG